MRTRRDRFTFSHVSPYISLSRSPVFKASSNSGICSGYRASIVERNRVSSSGLSQRVRTLLTSLCFTRRAGFSFTFPFSIWRPFLADSAGNVTQGVEDYHDASTFSANVSFAGTAGSVSSNGRGPISLTSVLGKTSFAFYVISANEALVVETDSTFALAGWTIAVHKADISCANTTGHIMC